MKTKIKLIDPSAHATRRAYIAWLHAHDLTVEAAYSIRSRKAPTKPKPARITLRTTHTLRDPALASRASNAARTANGRISNWESASPSQAVVTLGDYDDIDNGQYSRSCKYTHWTHLPRYTSCVTIGCEGRALVYRAGFAEDLYSRFLPAPKGMIFTTDNNGLRLTRTSDGMDYHITPDDLRARNFATRVRDALAANYQLRVEAKRAARNAARFEVIFTRDLASISAHFVDLQPLVRPRWSETPKKISEKEIALYSAGAIL